VVDYKKDTIQLRLDRYDRRIRHSNWIGGGYLAIIGIIATGLFDDIPHIFLSLVVTLVVLGGWAAATVRVKYDWASTQLKRSVKNDSSLTNESKIAADYLELPSRAEIAWDTALLLLTIAGLTLLIGAWYKVFTCCL